MKREKNAQEKMKTLDIFCQFHNSNHSPPPIPSPYFSTGLLFLKKEEETKEVASAKVKKGNEEEPIVFISSLLDILG
jgi:hypothetical protein